MTTLTEAVSTRTQDWEEVLVFARIQERVRQLLDRPAEEQVVPRSMLVEEILRQWVEQRAGDCAARDAA